MKTYGCISDNSSIGTGMPQESFLSHVLYFVFKVNLNEIFFNTNKKVTAVESIYDVFLFATSSSISKTAYH